MPPFKRFRDETSNPNRNYARNAALCSMGVAQNGRLKQLLAACAKEFPVHNVAWLPNVLPLSSTTLHSWHFLHRFLTFVELPPIKGPRYTSALKRVNPILHPRFTLFFSTTRMSDAFCIAGRRGAPLSTRAFEADKSLLLQEANSLFPLAPEHGTSGVSRPTFFVIDL